MTKEGAMTERGAPIAVIEEGVDGDGAVYYTWWLGMIALARERQRTPV
jgi:hypothetical protein